MNKLILASFIIACVHFAGGFPGNNQKGYTAASQDSVRVPVGYSEIFRADFSNTILTRDAYDGNQWWWTLSGGEFGYDWQNCPQFTGGTGEPKYTIRLQPLVSANSILTDYIENSIVDVGGKHGKVLKFLNHKDDPNFKSLSRSQFLISKLAPQKIFYEFRFNLSQSLVDILKDYPKAHWLDLTEFHDIRGVEDNHNRLSFFIKYDIAEAKYYYSTELRDDKHNMVRWKKVHYLSSLIADTWHTVDFQMETVGTGPEDAKVFVWVDGVKVCDNPSCEVGEPANLNLVKLYVDNGSMVNAQSPVSLLIDDIKIYAQQ